MSLFSDLLAYSYRCETSSILMMDSMGQAGENELKLSKSGNIFKSLLNKGEKKG